MSARPPKQASQTAKQSAPKKPASRAADIRQLKVLLNGKPIVLVGMMGAGKTSVGRRLANQLGFEFVDSDIEIEAAADMSIPEIFESHGEDYFRSGEQRVIARLLKDKNQVLATGGGAFMNAETRDLIQQQALSVFIKADLDLLFERVSRRANRPLLQTADPKGTLGKLIDERYSTYEQADITVLSRDVPQDAMASDIATAILIHLKTKSSNSKSRPE